MAKVTSTRGISYYIERLISEAQTSITLVTPYLKIAQPLYDRLVLANARGVEITVVYGKTKLLKKQEQQLKKLENCRIVFVENLHAKVYISDRCGIIGSMTFMIIQKLIIVNLVFILREQMIYLFGTVQLMS